MQIFDETENRYYEYISWLVNAHEDISENDIRNLFQSTHLYRKKLIPFPEDVADGMDPSIVDRLTDMLKESGILVQDEEEDKESYLMPGYGIPIRATSIERQTWKNLADTTYGKQFLKEETFRKIHQTRVEEESMWSDSGIHIRNQFAMGQSEQPASDLNKLMTIARAIKECRVLICNNIRPGKFAFYGSEVYPVRMEYSMQNDMFRVSCYVPAQQEFIQMNTIYMSDVRLGPEHFRDMEEEYRAYLEGITRQVTLEIESDANAIERCFRLFSFHNRVASYDSAIGQYRLTLEYYEYDVNEVVRDILSLGSRVVVVEPESLRLRVRERIRRALAAYENR